MESNIRGNDIYIFFEAMEQLEPQSILDVGMLLKRAGGVSRKAMGQEIPEGVRFDGIDFFPEADFPAWRNVYDEILDVKAFLERMPVRKYGCAVLLGMETLQANMPIADAWPDLVRNVQEHARHVLSDQKFDVCGRKHKVTELKEEEDVYYLFDFGE